MRVKFTIAVCALLVLALGASQAYAQSGGWDVSRGINTVVQHGKNQMMGEIQLDYNDSGGNVDAGGTITVTFDGLPITSIGTVGCTVVMCPDDGVPAINEDEDTLTIVTTDEASGVASINLRGVRVDVSSLDAGDEIMATISSSAPSGLIPIGQSRRGTVSAAVAEVKAGLVVEIDSASRLICNLSAKDDDGNPVGGRPMITVKEGFASAWEAGTGALGGTKITIKTLNLPKGVRLIWPDGDDPTMALNFYDPDDKPVEAVEAVNGVGGVIGSDGVIWSTLTLAEAQTDDSDGSEVVFNYAISEFGVPDVDPLDNDRVTDANVKGVVDSFAIPIMVDTTGVETGAGGIADIWAFLSPVAKEGTELADTLAYVMNPVTDPETDDGDFLNVAECVTYLLFPYITCGAHADWDTGIAIANTTMDDDIFGLSAGATAQRGSVTMYAFPTSRKTAHNNASDLGYTGEPTMTMLSGDLAAGDSLAMTCSSNDALAGMQGYAIVKAGFRHAHGMAFVTNSASGAVDAVHGYVALVIPDPEFGGDNKDRAAAEGESLGH